MEPQLEAPPKDLYAIGEPAAETFSSGCTLLDCALGGGWGFERVANVIGDKSTGKTLLAIEACANFHLVEPDGKIEYREAEAAFDIPYAENLGLPVDAVDFGDDPVFTVEDVFEDIEKMLGRKERTLYVVDSMDALSDRAEQGRDMDEGTYGTKSRKVSEWFRRQNHKLAKSRITLIVISQVRDNIGVQFGAKHKRSGGRALDFYATHALWLAHTGQVKRTRKGVERVVGVNVLANVKKNKIGPPFRKVDFPLMFGYGVEDVRAGLDWLIKVGRTEEVGLSKEDAKKLVSKVEALDDDRYYEERRNVNEAVRRVWSEIETDFRPRRRKYGGGS